MKYINTKFDDLDFFSFSIVRSSLENILYLFSQTKYYRYKNIFNN